MLMSGVETKSAPVLNPHPEVPLRAASKGEVVSTTHRRNPYPKIRASSAGIPPEPRTRT